VHWEGVGGLQGAGRAEEADRPSRGKPEGGPDQGNRSSRLACRRSRSQIVQQASLQGKTALLCRLFWWWIKLCLWIWLCILVLVVLLPVR
jgi:hypothetical protein